MPAPCSRPYSRHTRRGYSCRDRAQQARDGRRAGRRPRRLRHGGLAFAVAYGVIENVRPGAFETAKALPASFPDLVSLSFVTLLTIGFGDVTPLAPLARALVLFEGLFGVIFTTVVMASLVAGYSSTGSATRQDKSAPALLPSKVRLDGHVYVEEHPVPAEQRAERRALDHVERGRIEPCQP